MQNNLFNLPIAQNKPKAKTANPTGHVIYEGASLLDGKPIVVIAIHHSKNAKTGDMVQTFILRADIDPITANKTGEDYSICGNCKLKGEPTDNPNALNALRRTCYVVVKDAPRVIYNAYKNGKYPAVAGHDAIASIGKGRKVRLGAYGDPVAVPAYIWESILSESTGHTGYSHSYDVQGIDFRPDIYMVSADSLREAQAAWQKGWRTFRLAKNVSEITENEILCPAHAIAGRRTKCVNCGLCGGSNVDGKNIVNVVHGFGSKYFKG